MNRLSLVAGALLVGVGLAGCGGAKSVASTTGSPFAGRLVGQIIDTEGGTGGINIFVAANGAVKGNFDSHNPFSGTVTAGGLGQVFVGTGKSGIQLRLAGKNMILGTLSDIHQDGVYVALLRNPAPISTAINPFAGNYGGLLTDDYGSLSIAVTVDATGNAEACIFGQKDGVQIESPATGTMSTTGVLSIRYPNGVQLTGSLVWAQTEVAGWLTGSDGSQESLRLIPAHWVGN